jgi:hypothetical protein
MLLVVKLKRRGVKGGRGRGGGRGEERGVSGLLFTERGE